MEPVKLEKQYTVHVYEAGPNGRLDLCSMFNYFQDIASDHAIRLGFGRDDLLRENHFWVLSRMYAEFMFWPAWGEIISVTTWPNGTDKLFALRNYEARTQDGKVFASATSSWLILDQSTRRIQRPDSILSRFKHELNPGESPVRFASKLEGAAGDEIVSERTRINTSDLDMNLHTNNTKYIRWVMDSYDLEFIIKNRPVSAEINYLAESVLGQHVFVRSAVSRSNIGSVSHSVIREDDMKELCHVHLQWHDAGTNT
ncbi:MAG: thioesterase [Bacteroidales bacterium]|jgi:acyl-ACP thioesterase|nr:thioesterase [Bacteroidales bacterium]